MSNELFGDALSKSERDLSGSLQQLQDVDRRYRSGEGIGFDVVEMLRLGTETLQLMQQVESARATRNAPAAGGGRLSANDCRMLQDNANECRKRQGEMRSGGSGKLGTKGQAGAFQQCYEVYSEAYSKNCR